MGGIIIDQLDTITELLQYFTGSVVITKTTGGLAATGIGSGWTIGDTLLLSGTSNSNIEVTITYIHTDNSYMLTTPVSTAFGDDETAGSGKLNQTAYTAWQDIRGYSRIVGSIYASGAADYWIQQSWNASDVDVQSTKADLSAATPTSFSVEAVAPYARLRILSEDADQTVMRAYLGGRVYT